MAKKETTNKATEEKELKKAAKTKETAAEKETKKTAKKTEEKAEKKETVKKSAEKAEKKEAVKKTSKKEEEVEAPKKKTAKKSDAEKSEAVKEAEPKKTSKKAAKEDKVSEKAAEKPAEAEKPKRGKKAAAKNEEAAASGNDGEIDEATKELYAQRIKDILALAKKKKNVLEYAEISDFFAELNLNEEQFDNVLEVLENSGIDILRVSETDDDIPDDDDMLLTDEDEVDMENIDLSVPDGISIEDPVRMYLKEIGKVPLLNADQEIELAKAMEAGLDAEKQLEEDKDNNKLSEAKKKELNAIIYEGDEAKKRLAEANLRLVVSIAKRYVGRGMLFLDLIQEGNLGLIKAVESLISVRDSNSQLMPHGGLDRPSQEPLRTRQELSVFLFTWLRPSTSSFV